MQGVRFYPNSWLTYALVMGLLALSGLEAFGSTHHRLLIPEVALKEATLEEAIRYLRAKTAEVDTREPDETRRGINIIIIGVGEAQRAKRITLQLKNVDVKVALDEVAKIAGVKIRIDPYAVVVVPIDAPEPMHTRINLAPVDPAPPRGK